MKKTLIILISLILFSPLNAESGTQKVLDNVYSKGSETVEKFIFNLLPDGPGDTEVSIQAKQDNKPTGSIMFVRPFSIEDDSVLFYQAQFNNSYISGKNRKSINYGLGKRILSDDKSYFMGLNSFFDLDHKYNKRLSLGAELYASNFELNGNYYFGFGGGNHVRDNTERVLDGRELNIKGQVPYTPWANIAYNNYKWLSEKNSDDSSGDKFKGEFYVTNNFTFEFGLDDNNINKDQYFAKLIYLPYSKERPTMADGHSSKAFLNSDVREKMLQRVERSNLLVLELESSGVVVVNGN